MKNLLVASIMGDSGYDEEGNALLQKRIKLVCRADEDSTGRVYAWYTESGEDCQVSARTLQGAKRAAWQAWGTTDSPWYMRATWITPHNV